MENLIEGKSYDFEVVKDKCKLKFFRIKTPSGQEFELHKFKFQYNQPLPDFITCFIKQLNPTPLIIQDIAIHLKNFYQRGKEYDFKVKNIKKEQDIIYQIEDEHGFCFNLINSTLNLNKGNEVRCLVTNINGANVNLKYVGTITPRFPIEYLSIADWLGAIKVKANVRYYRRLLAKIPEFDAILKKHDEKDPTWILDILQACTIHLPQWLTKSRNKLQLVGRINRKVEIARKVSLYIIEESDYLQKCTRDQRISLQSKLSNFAEQFEQYGTATSKILTGTHEQFIDKMFEKLKKAGYLYKPERQIRIMMTILKLRPELIHSRMGELFETLHNWDMSNWNAEPFREALVQHLQLFIEENYGKIHRLATNDSTSDNRVISRLILSLAVQRLFATEDDGINYNLNRAILYRYNSYRITNEAPVLLQKSIDSLLGLNMRDEYTWEDTNNPNLLFNKLAINIHEPENYADIVKTYSTSKVDIQLKRDKLSIIAKDSEPETTVLPNGLFDWLNPQISLPSEATVKSGKKTKNLRDFKEMWEQINWSIFGLGEEEVTEKLEKRQPVVGDEVKFIFDDVRIVPDAYEKQRLQFHCTLKDDIFVGEGWIPCDTLHFVGWLSDNNFDGSMKFAIGENGLPLIYKAKVSAISKKGLIFSLREQIDNYLLDTSFPGQETIAVVTAFDKSTNSYICLGENGASYKIINDDNVNSSLYIGQVVRVTYFEPDRSNYNSQYFIGLLSRNQQNLPSTFNKNNSLYHLMQGLGEMQEQEDYSTVIESEQLMTQEEIIELILIMHRRANYEKEYPKAYNLLGLASIIAKAANEKKLYDDLIIQMELFELLQEFGKNRKIDPETVDQFSGKVSHSPILERLHTRLKIVSEIEMNENSRWLWDLKHNPRNETEGQLAALVLSYNLLPKELESPRKQIMNQISSLLDVTTREITSKYYGDESQMVEFKSSMVYSPKFKNRPAPREQLWEITHIICGFMNARGGRLYIGVNDAGYENGLEDDIAYRKQNGQRTSIDSMIVDLQNHLDRSLPLHAKDHFHILSDPESKKGVIIVEIAPVREPVEFENTIYVRTSSVTKPRYDEEREAFIKDRPSNYDNLRKLWDSEFITGSEKLKNESISLNKEDSSKESLILNENLNNKEIEITNNKNKLNKISTSLHRPNVLHDYEENYVEPSFYIYFNSDNSIILSNVDSYRETEDDCLLVLAVNEKESSQYLLLTDENQKVKKLSLAHLKEKGFDKKYDIGNDNIKIANIGKEKDYLLSVIKSAQGAIYYRLDDIKNFIPVSGSTDSGKLICENPHSIILQEVVSTDKLNLFDAEAKDKDSKIYGFPIPVGDGTLSEEERIQKLLTGII